MVAHRMRRRQVANGRAATTMASGGAASVSQQSVAGGLSPFLERDRWVTVWGMSGDVCGCMIRSRDGRSFLDRGRACPTC